MSDLHRGDGRRDSPTPPEETMTIRIIKRGAAKDRPFCPFVIDYPEETQAK